VPCLILRSLSDSAGAKAQENVLLFEKSAAQNAALLVTCLVRESVSAVVAAQPFLKFRTDCSTRERVAVARGR